MAKKFIVRGGGSNRLKTITVIVDDADACHLRSSRWSLMVPPKGHGVPQPVTLDFSGYPHTLGRWLLKASDKTAVIHKNGDKFDYRRSNLEVITVEEKWALMHKQKKIAHERRGASD